MATAQTREITGTVVSAEDDQPVIGASVVVKGTTTGTVTNFDGKFSLNVPTNARTLVISYIGMESQEAVVSPNMRIALKNSSLLTAWGPYVKTVCEKTAAWLHANAINR